jgi:O-antigen ligase
VVVVDPGSIAPSGTVRIMAIAVLGAVAALALPLSPGQGPASPAPGAPSAGGPLTTISRVPVLGRAADGWEAPVAWAVLLAALGISTLAADDRGTALWGTPERHLGLLAWIGFALWFAVGARLGATGLGPLARGATIATALVVALAGLEVIDLDPTGTAWSDDRVGAPLAQPTYVAAALVLLTPLVLALAADPGSARPWRIAAGATAGGALATLAATGSRGPMLGLGAALAVLAVARAGRSRPRAAAPAGVAVLAVTAAAVLTASAAGRGWGSLTGRLDEWAVGLRALARSPLVGYGPDGYRGVFWSVVDPGYVADHGAEVLTDRAHNALIDVGLAGGGVALVAFGLLWVLVAAAAWRRLAPDGGGTESVLAVGAAVGTLAYLTQQIVLFPLAELDPLWWLTAGLVVAGSPTGSPAARATDHRAGLGDRIGAGARMTAPSVAAGVLVLTAAGNLPAARAEHLLGGLGEMPARLRPDEAARATALAPFSPLVVVATARVQATAPTILDLDRALASVETGLTHHPSDPALRFEHGALLIERAQRSGLPEDAGTAVTALADVVADAPGHPGSRFRYAIALHLAGRDAEAAHQVELATRLDPDHPLVELLPLVLGES